MPLPAFLSGLGPVVKYGAFGLGSLFGADYATGFVDRNFGTDIKGKKAIEKQKGALAFRQRSAELASLIGDEINEQALEGRIKGLLGSKQGNFSSPELQSLTNDLLIRDITKGREKELERIAGADRRSVEELMVVLGL
jgi:hypothetical protein